MGLVGPVVRFETTGAVGVSVTVMEALLWFGGDCAPSEATAVRVFRSTSRGMVALQCAKLSLVVAGTPLSTTLTIPETASAAVPWTVIMGMVVVLALPGLVMLTDGLVASCVDETMPLYVEVETPSVAFAR